MSTKRKRKDHPSSRVAALQDALAYVPALRTRKHAMSPILAKKTEMFLSNSKEPYGWQLTSNPCIVQRSKDNKKLWYVQVKRRGREADKRGKLVWSSGFETQAIAENYAFEFRFSRESKHAKEKLNNCLTFIKSVMEEQPSNPSTNTTAPEVVFPKPTVSPEPSPVNNKKRSRGPYKIKSLIMTTALSIVTVNVPHMNPNSRPMMRRESHWTWYEACVGSARRVQHYLRKRTQERAEKALAKMKTDQCYRLKIIEGLTKKIATDDWTGLLLGGDDTECIAGFSTWDREHVLLKCRHVCDALIHMFNRTANYTPCTWLEACDASAKRNFNKYTGRTVSMWYAELHSTPLLRFRPNMRGHSSDKAKSPFLEDESLLMQFKSWARSDLEHLNTKKATDWINTELLKDWTTEQFERNKISYPVSTYVASRWMHEAGFKYERHKKSYYVDRHEDKDVVQSRIEYIETFFKEEIYEACWLQLRKSTYERMVRETASNIKCSAIKQELKDAKEQVFTFLKGKAHHYTNAEGQQMVEVHVDTFSDMKKLNVGPMGGHLSVRMGNNKRQRIRFGQDEVIFRSSQLNDYCWSISGEQTMRSKGLGEGQMVSGMTSREFGFGLTINDAQLAEINRTRATQEYKDKEAAEYLLGTAAKKNSPLKSSPFTRILNYGKGKDGYWSYNHMVLQIEDCIDCMQVLFPEPNNPTRCKYDLVFELDHSSGHNADRKDGLTTTSSQLNSSWGGKQRFMRESTLTAEDIGSVEHPRALKVGDIQFMHFRPGDLPPVDQRDAPPNDTGTGDYQTKEYNVTELRKILEDNSMSSDGNKPELVARLILAGIPTTYRKEKKIDGYIGKQKGALQIAYERGFFDDTLSVNGHKVSMMGHILVKGDKKRGIKEQREDSTSVLKMLRGCNDFKTEKTQLQSIVEDELGCFIRLTPKCHPEIAGVGIEYAWGYSKFRFRKDFNNGKREHLTENVRKALSTDTLSLDRMRKFARKAREYKLTYHYFIEKTDGSVDRMKKECIESITKVFKQHRSALDADYSFVVSS